MPHVAIAFCSLQHTTRNQCCHQASLHLQEYVNGQLKNKYGDAFIRGNNGEWSTLWLMSACCPTTDSLCLLPRSAVHQRCEEVMQQGICVVQGRPGQALVKQQHLMPCGQQARSQSRGLHAVATEDCD